MRSTYNIIEIANTHGGSLKYLHALIDQFAEFGEGFGMKFQPFKYDKISAEDFSWYETYKELYFTPDEWKDIISKTADTKDVWLDMFDMYSVQILQENLQSVYGIKLQASVLYNFEMLSGLEEIDLSNIIIQVNIAGYEVDEIKSILDRLKKQLSPKSFIIQFGFQNYPTEFEDAGLSKIAILKNNFPEYELCFADHLDGESEEALIMPVFAAQAGCTYIEKHVYYDQLETKYDKFSSVSHSNYKKLLERMNRYTDSFNEKFINDREKQYLQKSMQIPFLKKDVAKGNLISIASDLDFKRTDQKGLNVKEIKELLDTHHILGADKKAGEVLKREDFKKATIATIVACRMKSSRLPKKAIAKIGDLTSIELCLKNVLKFKHINHTVLATSILEEDAVLKDYIYNKTVVFHQGDPEDVIQRYLDIIEKLNVDVVIRLTGDCPYPSADIEELVLASHFSEGADFSTANDACIGLNMEVYNVSALRRIKEYFPYADYSEYMTYYVTNNPKHFKINKVALPQNLIRNYRLTLDYPEDLILFNKIEEYLKKEGLEYSAAKVFEFLDNNPHVAEINRDCTVLYKENDDLIQRINKATTIID